MSDDQFYQEILKDAEEGMPKTLVPILMISTKESMLSSVEIVLLTVSVTIFKMKMSLHDSSMRNSWRNLMS